MKLLIKKGQPDNVAFRKREGDGIRKWKGVWVANGKTSMGQNRGLIGSGVASAMILKIAAVTGIHLLGAAVQNRSRN